MRKLLLTAGAVLAIAAASQASIVVTTPVISVPEGTPSVTFNITANPGADTLVSNVQGYTLYFQVGDGTAGPTITSAAVQDAGLFTTANSNVPATELGERYYIASAATNPAVNGGNVAADGILATITLNTAGLTPGTWNLNPFLTIDGEDIYMDFAGIAADEFSIGSLTITAVPEPAALALLGLGGLFIRRRRA